MGVGAARGTAGLSLLRGSCVALCLRLLRLLDHVHEIQGGGLIAQVRREGGRSSFVGHAARALGPGLVDSVGLAGGRRRRLGLAGGRCHRGHGGLCRGACWRGRLEGLLLLLLGLLGLVGLLRGPGGRGVLGSAEISRRVVGKVGRSSIVVALVKVLDLRLSGVRLACLLVAVVEGGSSRSGGSSASQARRTGSGTKTALTAMCVGRATTRRTSTCAHARPAWAGRSGDTLQSFSRRSAGRKAPALNWR